MIELVLKFLEDLFLKSELNRLPESYGRGFIFSKPLIGVSRGDDPIFEKYKELISPKHLTPKELWNASQLPDEKAYNLRIISILCPFTSQIREESIKAKLVENTSLLPILSLSQPLPRRPIILVTGSIRAITLERDRAILTLLR